MASDLETAREHADRAWTENDDGKRNVSATVAIFHLTAAVEKQAAQIAALEKQLADEKGDGDAGQ